MLKTVRLGLLLTTAILLLLSLKATADTVAVMKTTIIDENLITNNTKQLVYKAHAIAMHGKSKYAADFAHFDYVNPQAPKGGKLINYSIGGFDSFNSFIPKGVAAVGTTKIYDSLLTASADEPFTRYGLIAQTIEWPQDRSWVIFHINPKARFHDGKPITADDVKFSFDILMEKGAPAYQFYYQDVIEVQALDTLTVKYTFKDDKNRELMLSVGDLPIFPKHYWQEHDFGAVNLNKPLGSGAYKIGDVQTNKRVVYERVKDYWAQDLSVNRGRNNFDQVIYDYYGDRTVAFEAFKKGNFNFFEENNSKRWATSHKGKPYDDGTIIKELIAHQQPAGMQGFAFNIRRPLFQDIILRQAMELAFDFEWSNENLFYGQYKRSYSYFSNTNLAAKAEPTTEELNILLPYKDQFTPEEQERIFTSIYQPPVTTGKGKPRANLIKAQTMLQDAGYTIIDNQLYTPKGEPVTFEFLIYSPAFIRIILPFQQNLKTLGISFDIRKVDVTQYIERLKTFDFDMMVLSIGQSLSPGNEQWNKWHSSSADKDHSKNYIGIKHPVIDSLVENVIKADSRQDLVIAARALDRVLLANYYVIPNWHINEHRLSYHKPLQHTTIPPYDLDMMAWWHEGYEQDDVSAASTATISANTTINKTTNKKEEEK